MSLSSHLETKAENSKYVESHYHLYRHSVTNEERAHMHISDSHAFSEDRAREKNESKAKCVG